MSQAPNESCALLFCRGDIIHDIFLTENVLNSSTRFSISLEQLRLAYKIAETQSFDTVAIFHSHPNSIAYPSKTDEQFMYVNPVPWLIYSGVTCKFKAFILDVDVLEIPLVVL